MSKKILKGIVSTTLAITLITFMAFVAFATSVVDEVADYHGKVLVAVNTETGDNANYQTFSAESVNTDGTGSQGLEEAAEKEYTHTSGLEYAELPAPTPLNSESTKDIISTQATEATLYEVSDTKTINSAYQTNNLNCKVNLTCLYTGTHCTVWGQNDCNAEITLNTTHATSIGTAFDGYYDNMVGLFGEVTADVDNDGKIAIFCYDLKNEYATYPNSYSGSYTGGYFWGSDMIDDNGTIDNVQFGSAGSGNTVDCIHIDTYPTMGNYSKLSNISGAYSTLIHEFQHLINFSYRVVGRDNDTVTNEMDIYLDEGFSMAAEHSICGESTVANRIESFNEAVTTNSGLSLTAWDYSTAEYTIDRYGMSYVFGQYIRTRYAQIDSSYNGATIFRETLSRRTSINEDTLGIIADLLYPTSSYQGLTSTSLRKEQLLKDFWTAAWSLDESGIYGFNGEAFAEAIDIKAAINTSLPTTSTSIYNGGACFYYINNGGNGTSTVLSSGSNMRFSAISSDASEAYEIVYDANGGSNAPLTQTGLVSYNISGSIPTRFGYVFIGWSKSATATTASYLAGDEFVPNSNTTLYAVWKLAGTVTIAQLCSVNIELAGQEQYYKFTPSEAGAYIFISTGSLDVQIYLYGPTGTLLASNDDISAANSNFKLNCSLTANTIYYIKVKAYSDQTGSFEFVAQKDTSTYTVTYDINGGSGTVPVTQSGLPCYTINQTLAYIPAKFGCNFIGWSEDSAATTATYLPGDDIIPAHDTTLYAIWTPAITSGADSEYPFSISFRYNKIYYAFTPTATSIYSFTSTGALNTEGFFYNSEGKELSRSLDISTADKNFKLSYYCTVGNTYYIMVSAKGNRTGVSTLAVTDTAPKKYTLSFSSNSVNLVSYEQTGGTSYTISTEKPERFGFNFLGWSSDIAATQATYQPGDTVSLTNNMTLYAVWNQVVLTANLDITTMNFQCDRMYYYSFTPTANAIYAINSIGDVDTIVHLYNASGEEFITDDNGGNNSNFRLEYSLIAGTTYYYGVAFKDTATTGTLSIMFGTVYTVKTNNLLQLMASAIQPESGITTTWVSSNEEIATVNENGVVTGKSRGNIQITATDSNNNVSIYYVKVKSSNSSISILSTSNSFSQKVNWWKSYSSAKMSLEFQMYNCTGATSFVWT